MLNKLNKKIYFISGPTAIGKSELAIRLAKKINGIIINSDSMQVYSNLKIITARPSNKDQKIIKHKLYGYVDGAERYNVAKWCDDIVRVISQNDKNNQPSIIVGGTGMYINSLINGLIELPKITEEYKNESKKLLNKIGINKFVKIISKFDPISLDKISSNDLSRVRRIWEIYHSTGFTYSYWKEKKNKLFLNKPTFNLILFKPPRDLIYKKVNDRFKKMIKEGAIDEVKNFIKLGLDYSLPLMRAHGVPEISNYLDEKITLSECVTKGQQVTRNYVKRQLTWWRSSTLSIHQEFDQFPIEIDENMINI